MKTVLELEGGDGWTVMWILNTIELYTYKMVKILRFMLYVFCLTKNDVRERLDLK